MKRITSKPATFGAMNYSKTKNISDVHHERLILIFPALSGALRRFSFEHPPYIVVKITA